MGAPITAFECPQCGKSGGTAELFRPEQLAQGVFCLKRSVYNGKRTAEGV